MRDAADAALPSQRYAQGVARGDWNDDPAQHPALAELDRLHAALLAPDPRRPLDRLRQRPRPAPTGPYPRGGGGRGNALLTAPSHAGLPLAAGAGKRRTHFHRFMREVHAQLREHAGEADPLKRIAARWRDQLRVLVLDEFFVNDIGDAMLLGRLLERLFA